MFLQSDPLILPDLESIRTTSVISSYLMGARLSLLVAKFQEHEPDHTTPCSAQVKNK